MRGQQADAGAMLRLQVCPHKVIFGSQQVAQAARQVGVLRQCVSHRNRQFRTRLADALKMERKVLEPEVLQHPRY